jgi:hypothetical protein
MLRLQTSAGVRRECGELPQMTTTQGKPGGRLWVGVELPDELHREVEAYAQVHGLQRSEALRYLIEAGLAAEAHAMHEKQQQWELSGAPRSLVRPSAD